MAARTAPHAKTSQIHPALRITVKKKTDESLNPEASAYRLWPRLAHVAKRLNPTISFDDLADAAELSKEATLAALPLIRDYCNAERLPPLNAVVLRDAPHSLRAIDPKAQAIGESEGEIHVTQFPWDVLGNPFDYAKDGATEGALTELLLHSPEQADAIYAQVRVRGIAQRIFKRALGVAYRGQCAMCGLTLAEALVATHVIPWHEASPAQRLNPTNGLLLCATHHRLITEGRMTITTGYEMVFRPPFGRTDGDVQADTFVGVALQGQRILLPERPKHWPDRQAIEHHHRRHYGTPRVHPQDLDRELA